MLKVNIEGRTSQDYRFTTDDSNHKEVLALKALAKKNNKHVREMRRNGFNWPFLRLQRVILKGRGPRKAASLRDSNGRNSTMYTSHLKKADAVRFDVYYANDTHAEWIFGEELRNAGIIAKKVIRPFDGIAEIVPVTEKATTKKTVTVVTTTTTTFE